MKLKDLQLGAIALSPDILGKANIGLWAFELDEGKEPRMYVDETMLGLVGLKEQVSPELTYHAWYDNIDEGSYGLVADAVDKMVAGEHAEVQYPWHHPDGRTMIVRCGGVRNPQYTAGVRIEGTHQDVTLVTHFDEETRRRLERQELQIKESQLRADALAFISDHEPDVKAFLDFFGGRILELAGCDQVIYRNQNGERLIYNAPGVEDVSTEICGRCPFANITDTDIYPEGIALMNDCRKGFKGIFPDRECQAKSSVMQHVYSDGKLAGLLTFHYLTKYHDFSDEELGMLKTLAAYLGLLLGRVQTAQLRQQTLEMEQLRRELEMQDRLKEALKEAQSANMAKTLYLNSMSHDIRTPMNAIIGYTSMARKYVDDRDKALGYLNRIGIAGNNLLELINQVLDMSRIEAGKVVLDEEEADVIVKVREMAEIFEPTARDMGIEFENKIGAVSRSRVIADPGRINQVIMNLLGNAMKYTPEGGKVTYEVSEMPCDKPGYGTYVFTVQDTGIGMSKEYLEKIFEPFSRENTSTVSKIQGTGLGMSIVKRLVDLMGGTIEIESEQGKGTRITVTLTFKLARDTEVQANARTNGADAHVLSGRRALLVEDNEMNREIAAVILEEQGIIVETADDGDVAVEMVRKIADRGDWGYYDFILMDIQMPRMNGYEATKLIRAIPGPESAHIPIIAMTANAFAEDRRHALNVGMDDHIAKPIDIKTLWETLAKFV